MSKIEDLVPPRELCKQIPKDAFTETAMVWWGAAVYPRIRLDGQHYGDIWHKWGTFPAPTLQELLMEFENSGIYCPTCSFRLIGGTLTAKDAVDEEANKLPCPYEAADYDNPATAALRLWFEVNGIEVKE